MNIQDQLKAACKSGRNVLLIGVPGVGKTHQLVECFEKNTEEYRVCWPDRKVLEGDSLISFLFSILPDSIERLPEKERNFDSFTSLLKKRERESPEKLVFILDQFNYREIPLALVDELERFLRIQNEAGTNFSVVMTVRTGTFYAFDNDSCNSLRSLLEVFLKIFVQPLSEDETERLITEKLVEEGNRSISPKTLRRLVYLSGGHPQLAIDLLNLNNWAKRFGTLAKMSLIIDIWEDLPPDVQNWFYKFLSVNSPKTKIAQSAAFLFFIKLGLIKDEERLSLFSPLLEAHIRKERELGINNIKFFFDALQKEKLFFAILFTLYISTGIILFEQASIASNWIFWGTFPLLALAFFYYLFLNGIYPRPGGQVEALQRFWIVNGLLFLILSIILFFSQNIWFLWLAICAVFSFAIFIRFRLEYSVYR